MLESASSPTLASSSPISYFLNSLSPNSFTTPNNMKNLFKLTVALTILSHAYADLDVDVDEVPATCQAICRPTLELSRICDVDDDLVGDNEVTEYNNERACYCSNQSFNVGQMTALCQSCVQQNSGFNAPDNTRGMLISMLQPQLTSSRHWCDTHTHTYIYIYTHTYTYTYIYTYKHIHECER